MVGPMACHQSTFANNMFKGMLHRMRYPRCWQLTTLFLYFAFVLLGRLVNANASVLFRDVSITELIDSQLRRQQSHFRSQLL